MRNAVTINQRFSTIIPVPHNERDVSDYRPNVNRTHRISDAQAKRILDELARRVAEKKAADEAKAGLSTNSDNVTKPADG